ELTPTLNFATRLDHLGVPMWVRYVLVPGWTDTPEPIEGLARFVSELPAVRRVDVLPFHKLGASKYPALGIPFALRQTPVPSEELVERVRGQFRGHGVEAY
ncbi:pyruvate formate-lyase-activating protein, partial [Streptomyces sp. 900105755]